MTKMTTTTKYDVRISNLDERQVTEMMSRLPEAVVLHVQKYTFSRSAPERAGPPVGSAAMVSATRTPSKRKRKGKKKRMSPDARLMATGKTATKGSQRAKILTIFEKLEKASGIATVTRATLRSHVLKMGADQTVVGQLIHDGYLKEAP